jgi:hypothetical protein
LVRVELCASRVDVLALLQGGQATMKRARGPSAARRNSLLLASRVAAFGQYLTPKGQAELGELVEAIWQDGFLVGAGGLPRVSPMKGNAK